ncbi:MAG: hypothetical protein V8S77_01210 [Oscillospiraceae bacterium]
MLRAYEAMMRINARKVSEGVAEAIFVNEAKTINEKKPYTIEAILRNSFGEIFHPNAVRYMLYMAGAPLCREDPDYAESSD